MRRGHRDRATWRRRVAFSAVIGAAMVLALSGCTITIFGLAVTEPGYVPGAAIPSLLSPGNYPTKPLPPFGAAGANGSIMEGQRMAEFVVGSWEVDPTLIVGGSDTRVLFKNADALAYDLLAPGSEIAARNNFVVGFSSNRGVNQSSSSSETGLSNAVLRFVSPDGAAAAAGEMSAQIGPEPGAGPFSPLSIPGHPEALAGVSELADGGAAIRSYTPRGIYSSCEG